MTPIVSTTLLRTQSDARLAELARGGSERAFEAIVERHRRPVGRYCARLVGESRSEDVVQDVFVKAWSALRGGPAVQDLKPWLYRIAHNTALNALRKRGYDYVELQESIRSAHGEPEAEQERRAIVLRTLSGIAALPEAQREALLRTAVDGLSQDEVARELGLSEPAVRGLVYRAREALRAGATAITPTPLLNWILGLGAESGTPRIAELVGAGGGAAGTGLIVKVGALAGAGVIATGAVTLKPLTLHHATPAARADTPAQVQFAGADDSKLRARPLGSEVGDDRSGRRGRGSGDDRGGDDSHRGRGGGDDSRDDHSSSGPGPGSDDRSGSDDSSSGSSGSSGSGSSGGEDSRSGSSGSGSGGSGSGTSGSGADDASTSPAVAPSGSDDSLSGGSGSGGSGTSGSGTSGSGTSGPGSSGSGSSGTGSGGSGSGDVSRTDD